DQPRLAVLAVITVWAATVERDLRGRDPQQPAGQGTLQRPGGDEEVPGRRYDEPPGALGLRRGEQPPRVGGYGRSVHDPHPHLHPAMVAIRAGREPGPPGPRGTGRPTNGDFSDAAPAAPSPP